LKFAALGYYVSGSINNLFQIYDHLHTKPTFIPIYRVVINEPSVAVTESVSVRITGVAAMSAVGTLTASGTVTAQPASLEATGSAPTDVVGPAESTGMASSVIAAAPVDVRKLLWQMHAHPKKLAEVPAGRLRWKLLRFPKASDKWAI
jgi:hypothetical protein